MSNTAVTPLFPTGRRVQAWCVSNLLSRRLTADTISTNSGTPNLRGTPVNLTQEQMDTLNFIDGYNVRLDKRCIGNFTNSASENIPFYFTFINPLPSANYRVFLQIRHSPTRGLWRGYTFLPWFAPSIINTTKYPKTQYGFFVEALYMSSRGQSFSGVSWTPLSPQGHPLGTGTVAPWLGAALEGAAPGNDTNTHRTSLVNLVVI